METADEIDLQNLSCSALIAWMRELRNSSDGIVSLTDSANYGRAQFLLKTST